ncbi:MAG: FG-GAP-like repeat-containing protein [Phycisphaerales bacterium]|nr:FG-GAP-like repeat-containing protein [Phycisphaerales bacterium]
MIRCHTITASALLTLLAPQFAAAQGDATRGGRMWDRWWIETHDAAPEGTHPLYPSTGRHAGPDSFRCNECHGWDYKGAEGNYSAGSHYTGIGGVLNSTTSPDDVFDLLKRDDLPGGHGFGKLGMTDSDIRDLTAFLRSGVLDMDEHIDADGRFMGNAQRGETYFTQGNGAAMQCIVCHGPHGDWRNFGTPAEPEGIGKIATENPWKLLHKIRYGHPGSIMPSWIQNGGTTRQAADIGAHAQTQLPHDQSNAPAGTYAVIPATKSNANSSPNTLKLSPATRIGNAASDNAHPIIAHVTIADLNQDGRNDVIACDINRGRVVWLEQQADGQLIETDIGGELQAPVHAEVSDVDGDGDLDVLVASMGIMLPSNEDIGAVIVLENDGTNHFTSRTVMDNIRRVTDVRPGDLDGDGDIDLAVSQFGYVQGEVQWLENLGEWEFKRHHLMDRSGAIHGPIADIDNDGDLDIVVLFSQEWETVQAFVNDGAGHFTPIVLHDVADADYSSSGLSMGDIDGDGDQDIAWTNGDAFVSVGYRPLPSHGLQWLENRGNLDFAFHRIGDFHGAYDPTILDLDGDGDQDILTVSEFAYWDEPNTPSLRWWSQEPDGSFTAQDLATAPTHLVTCDAGDLNGDGRPDIVAGGMALYQPFDKVDRIVQWTNEGRLDTGSTPSPTRADSRIEAAVAETDHAGTRGMICHANGLPATADTHYENAERANPNDAKWPYYRGLIDIEVGDSEAARSHLERAAMLDQSYPPLQSRLGELYAGQGNFSAAEQAFIRAGDIPLALLGRAQLAFREGDWQAVIDVLKGHNIPAGDAMRAAASAHLHGKTPANSSAVDMGLQYADPWLDEMRANAVLASAMVVQAQIAFIDGDLLRADRLLRGAVAAEPNDPDARLALANLLLLPHHTTSAGINEAAQHLDRALLASPRDVAIRSQRAWALFLQDQHDEAATEWERILEEEPAYAPSLLNLGQLHAKAGRHELALDYLRRGMAVPRDSAFSGSFEGPYRASWLLKLAAAAKSTGRDDEAIAAYAKAIHLTPNDPIARFQCGNALAGMKRFDEAAIQLEAADMLLPGKPRHLAALGYVMFKLDRLEESQTRLEAAVRGAPNYALAWYHLGNTKIKRGDVSGGRACFTQAVELQPEFRAAREALERTR